MEGVTDRTTDCIPTVIYLQTSNINFTNVILISILNLGKIQKDGNGLIPSFHPVQERPLTSVSFKS